MKKQLLSFLILFATTTILSAQPNFSGVISAIKSGNTTEISNFMGASVEVAVGSSDGTYAKADAIGVIKQFFQKNAPSNCTLVHSGAARDGASYYCIGNLSAGSGKYRVYVYFKETGGQYLIQEMRFEAE